LHLEVKQMQQMDIVVKQQAGIQSKMWFSKLEIGNQSTSVDTNRPHHDFPQDPWKCKRQHHFIISENDLLLYS